MTRRRRTTAAPVSLFAFQDIVTSITGIILLIAMAMAIQVAQAPAREKAGIDAAEYGVLTERLTSLRQQIEVQRAEVSANNATMEQTATIGPSGSEADLEKLRAESDRLGAQIAAQSKQIALDQSRDSQARAELAAIKAAMGSDETDRKMADAESRIARLRQSNRIIFNRPPASRGRVMIAELFRDRVLIASAGVSERPAVYTGSSYAKEAIEEASRSPRGTHWVLFAHPGSTEALKKLRAKLKDVGQSTGFDLLPDGVSVLDLETGAE